MSLTFCFSPSTSPVCKSIYIYVYAYTCVYKCYYTIYYSLSLQLRCDHVLCLCIYICIQLDALLYMYTRKHNCDCQTMENWQMHKGDALAVCIYIYMRLLLYYATTLREKNSLRISRCYARLYMRLLSMRSAANCRLFFFSFFFNKKLYYIVVIVIMALLLKVNS